MQLMCGYRAKLTVVLGCLLTNVLMAPTAQAGTTTTLTNFGSNPKNLPMYLYTPTNVGAKPPLLLHLHACHAANGGQSMCSSGNSFAQQADKYGFLMVCPSAVSSDQCWDVHSTADLTHDGTGSDSEGMMSAINYVIANKNADANRVYVSGYSSGGMMTQAMIGAYPDVFKAGAAFAGVPFGCFAQGSIDSLGWSSTCANGQVTMTGAQWGDLVRAAYPGYTGPRPRIQLWHGSVDTTVAFHNFAEAIKQWTNVLGVSETPTSTENNALQTGWIRTRYADGAGVVQVEAIQETGKGHGDLSVDPEAGEAIHFLGLDSNNPNPVPDGGTVTLKDSSVDIASPDAFIKMDLAGSTGGTTGTGGSKATGGTGATGGVTTSGGATSLGGATTSGGAAATAGATASAGTTATGGAKSTGGTTAAGGTTTSGGAAAAAGAMASAGTVVTGGVIASAGVSATGGAIQTGGSPGGMATGGNANTGGSVAGGYSTTSQATAAGGSRTNTEGASSAGSSASSPAKGGSSGCSFASGSPNRFSPPALLLVLGILALGWRRRSGRAFSRRRSPRV
jgi:poly(hydroxyalkanoate) depolymerase family esterase